MNYFDYIIATKLFGQGSGEQKEEVELNVTENGTYNAPDGQTYNPVNVNVSATTEKPYVTYTVNAQNQITDAKLYFDNTIPVSICTTQSELENVDLSGCVNLTSIGSMAFYYCPKLSTISIPSTVTSIGNNAFQACTLLVLTELPSGLITIGNNAFTHCDSFVRIELPSSLTTIGDRAFSYCKSLVSVTFSARPSSSLYALFDSCTNLLDIYVPWAEGEVTYAPWGAFNATIHYNWTEA